jgi:hypothetical protein
MCEVFLTLAVWFEVVFTIFSSLCFEKLRNLLTLPNFSYSKEVNNTTFTLIKGETYRERVINLIIQCLNPFYKS